MTVDELQALPVAAALISAAPGAVTGGSHDRQELMLEIAAERIVSACRYLKAEQNFARLSTITAIDWYPEEPRFEVVYHLHSPERNERLRLKCRLRADVRDEHAEREHRRDPRLAP